MRLATDLFAYCAERMPEWNTISISGYHIREAGASAAQELAFTLANGIAYCEAAVAAGLSPDAFGERLSFFFNAHNHFFQEVAKFRAARRLWAEIMQDRFGATNSRALALRCHAQTGGSTLTAQQPEINIVRVAIQALSAVCGGAQSLHTNSFDEALALPTERAASIALRTQQLLATEAGTTDTADPLAGSYFVETLTEELEQRARELIASHALRGHETVIVTAANSFITTPIAAMLGVADIRSLDVSDYEGARARWCPPWEISPVLRPSNFSSRTDEVGD